MTHPNFVTNGASLEDCHTNFFALADLCGIKWRRYFADSIVCYDPLDDPVVSSFSKCLAADILCVWRRIASPVHDHHRHNLQDCNQLNYKKELWIFWYGEEPDLNDHVSNELTADADTGSWESGLSYECRTLLFKALHNLIERSLLQRGFCRLGKWFVQPYDGRDPDTRSSQLTFCFNFFVHGESTVCSSIDVRQRPSISRLTEQHVSLAQASQAGLKVILSPFGLAGAMTGQSYKGTDLSTQRLLNDWHQFYPLRSRYNKDFHTEDEIPGAVEIIVSGVKMRYPSCYVMVVESDEATNVRDPSTNLNFQEGSTPFTCIPPQQKFMSSSSVLTPPTSPCDPSMPSGLHLSYKYTNHPFMTSESFIESPHLISSDLQNQTSNKIKQGTWQDSGLHGIQPPSDGSLEHTRGHWDFCDPATIAECRCSRCKDKSKTCVTSAKTVESSSSVVNSTATLNPAVSSTNFTSTVTSTGITTPALTRKTEKVDKNKVSHKFKGSIPFHKRNMFSDSLVDMDNFAPPSFNISASPGTPVLNNCTVNFQFKGPSQSLRAATPVGLPQLHTSVTQPSSLGSPLPGTPSLDGLNSQSSATEPAMPTLSPHPPLLKEEESAPALESQEQGVTTQSPSTIPESNNEALAKENSSTEQSTTPPLPAVIIKTEPMSPPPPQENNSWPSQEETKPVVTEEVPTATATTAPPATTTQGLKRPALVVASHNDPRDELVMEGMLYNYSFLNTSVWESIPCKRRRQRLNNIGSNEYADTFGESLYGNEAQLQMQLDDLSGLKTKDPYEFNDEFDEDSPSSSSFRVKVEMSIKEEEKAKEPGLPPTPETQGSLQSQAVTTAAPPTPTPDPPKPNATAEDQQSVSSPSSPKTQQASNFVSEKDLQVTDRDLENIFDSSSSDDSADDLGQTPSTPTSGKHGGTPEELFSAKCKSSSGCSGGILGVAELHRMFPTPPSLEHNTAPSPSGPLFGSDMTTLEGSDYRERMDIDGGCSPGYETVKDWSYVYKLCVLHKFDVSQQYAPLTSLPSFTSPISSELVYKPSWQVSSQQPTPPASCPATLPSSTSFAGPMERLLGSQSLQFPVLPVTEGERVAPSVFAVDPTNDQRNLTMAYELQSPASSASSYLNKHLNSIDSSSTILPIPEAHSLLVNIVISDSMLNIFKDHNFASCTLCVCNMNTKGADAGIYLPSNLIPSGTDEPQYKCTCGFSAVVNRHQSHRSGIFYEDELDITGHHYESFFHRKSLLSVEGNSKKMLAIEGSLTFDDLAAQVDHIPHGIVDLIKIQCSQLYSSFSLFHKAERLRCPDKIRLRYNALEVADGCEVCFLALDTGKQAVDNTNNNRMDESLKSSCLHKWPYLSAKVPASNLEVVRLLRSLQPMLQEAVQQRRHQRLWEVTYPVLGPLTWRQFHRLAGRGTEDQCEPQPIPSLLVGYDKDWLALSPFALKFWDKLLLEPYTHNRDVAYVVVAPDNDFVLGHIKTYFKELSTVYELCRLGRHCPITKVFRDGIMRVGKTTAKKLADEPVDEWFSLIGDGPIASRLKLYAQACRYHLAPSLSKQPLDSTLLDSPVILKPPEKTISAASPRPAFTDSADKEQPSVKIEPENQMDTTGPSSGAEVSAPTSSALSSGPQESVDSEDNQQIPTIVIYVVEPFTYGTPDSDIYRLSSLGLLRSYSQMMQCLPEHIRNAIQLQVISLDSIMSLGRTEEAEKRQDRFKDLAFSVFSRCHQLLTHQSAAKSLTGFGPAAAQDVFLKGKDARNSAMSVLTSKPFTLAPLKDKQTELGEMFGDRREKSSILYCTYCLTEDQRWLVASCTNDKGDILETCCISTEIPNRTRRKKACVRKFALCKLLDFIVEAMSKCLHTWRLVISRLGRLGHFELRDWATLLSRKSLLRYSRQLRELCHQCAVLSPPDTPAILSACLVSLEPDSALRIMSDQYTPDDRFSSSCNSCDLSTPEDASCTHILVFPTSATTQSTQATFQQEHIDPLAGTLGDDDIFQALNDDDITVGQDINDIFRWTESPTQSPGASPRRDSMSQPGSPSCGMGGRHSPFHHGGPNRGSGNLVMDTVEEPLQLLQQPLALGYYVSTAKTGPLPKWFWSTCPHLQNICPVFLKSALLIHSPSLQQNSDDLLHTNPHVRNCHPLDSNLTTDVLRYVLEGYNSLSWLSLDPTTHDRRSCLPVHIQVLMQLYHAVEALV